MANMLSYPKDLLGRREEMQSIYTDILESNKQVLVLHGQHGIGKTALLESLARAVVQDQMRFSRSVFVSCWQDKWSNVIARVARELVGRGATRSASLESLEHAIATESIRTNLLILLDNIEADHTEDFRRFAKLWTTENHKSVLLVTSTDELLSTETKSTYSRHEIQGVDKEASLSLAGDVLRQRFGDDLLAESMSGIDGVPLDILYLRWISPTDPDELRSTVARISSGDFDAGDTVESALLEVSESPIHFMALGVTNQLDFDEGLLAFFWDRLCGGTVEAYAYHRASLIDRKLLIPVQGLGRSVFRISEQVHKHLRSALERRIGGRTAIVHYYASEYYRRVLSDQREEKPLREFVFHSLASGEVGRAYKYVFNQAHRDAIVAPDNLQALRKPFLEMEYSVAIQHRDILQLFLTDEVSIKLSSEQEARVLVELAHMASDMGEFAECIELTSKVSDLLASSDGSPQDLQELWRRTWYYSGVSFYNSGRPQDCARSYYNIVSTSGDDSVIGNLCLGYFSHCLIQIDLEKAIKYGGAAVERARSIEDVALLTKNLASHAEALTYAGEYEAAASCLSEAAQNCQGQSTSTETREYGRIIGSLAALYLAKGDLDAAIKNADEAITISHGMGDYRRVACAQQYKAISLNRLNRLDEAYQEMQSAILRVAPENGRYALPPLLTLVKWQEHDVFGDTISIDPSKLDPRLRPYLLSAQSQAGMPAYLAFWRDYYWPLLCSA